MDQVGYWGGVRWFRNLKWGVDLGDDKLIGGNGKRDKFARRYFQEDSWWVFLLRPVDGRGPSYFASSALICRAISSTVPSE
jgi:hypothetical protein